MHANAHAEFAAEWDRPQVASALRVNATTLGRSVHSGRTPATRVTGCGWRTCRRLKLSHIPAIIRPQGDDLRGRPRERGRAYGRHAAPRESACSIGRGSAAIAPLETVARAGRRLPRRVTPPSAETAQRRRAGRCRRGRHRHHRRRGSDVHRLPGLRKRLPRRGPPDAWADRLLASRRARGRHGDRPDRRVPRQLHRSGRPPRRTRSARRPTRTPPRGSTASRRDDRLSPTLSEAGHGRRAAFNCAAERRAAQPQPKRPATAGSSRTRQRRAPRLPRRRRHVRRRRDHAAVRNAWHRSRPPER